MANIANRVLSLTIPDQTAGGGTTFNSSAIDVPEDTRIGQNLYAVVNTGTVASGTITGVQFQGRMNSGTWYTLGGFGFTGGALGSNQIVTVSQPLANAPTENIQVPTSGRFTITAGGTNDLYLLAPGLSTDVAILTRVDIVAAVAVTGGTSVLTAQNSDAANVLGAANFDLTTLVVGTPANLALSATAGALRRVGGTQVRFRATNGGGATGGPIFVSAQWLVVPGTSLQGRPLRAQLDAPITAPFGVPNQVRLLFTRDTNQATVQSATAQFWLVDNASAI